MTRTLLDAMLERRLAPEARAWLATARAEVTTGADAARFSSLLARASRFAPRAALAPTAAERAEATRLLPGWEPERWTALETLRVALVLARPDLDTPPFAAALEEAFRYADQGELCALYRSLAHLPRGERFTWRAGEGCRSNMRPVFEAVACDTPYPARHFDDLAWRQLVIKAVFIDAPLWRVHGLDGRLSPELARMALDLADERRSAGRPVQPELWLCLGPHGGERGLAALRRELEGTNGRGRRAALLALARAGARDELEAQLADAPSPDVAAIIRQALAGQCDQTAFRTLDERPS